MLELSGTDFRTFYTILPTDLILSYPARRNANKVKLFYHFVHQKPQKILKIFLKQSTAYRHE